MYPWITVLPTASLQHLSCTMALVVHCVFDAIGLRLEQGMPWGCGTSEPKPRPTVATEVFCGFSNASMGCVQGLGSYLSPMGRLYLLSLSAPSFAKLGDGYCPIVWLKLVTGTQSGLDGTKM